MDILQALRMRNIFGTPPLPAGSPSNIDPQFNMPVDPTWGSDVRMLQSPPAGFSDPGFEQSIIAPNPTTDTPIPTVEQPPNQPINQQNNGLSSIAQKMAGMYTPESQASDKYNQMIDQYPNREDYKPGFWSKLGAAIIDYTKGSKAGNEFRERPYENKLADWKNQIGPAGTAANLERNQNVNERTMAYNTGSNMLREQSIQDKEKNDTANLKIRQQRADVYDWKAKHPNMKIVFPKGGNIQAIDPVTGQTIDLGVSTGSLSDSDKYELQQTHAIERIDETGGQARKTEEAKQGNREDIQDRRAWTLGIDQETGKSVRINSITGEVRPITIGEKQVGPISKFSSTGNKPETAGNVKTKQYNAASQLKNTDPELGQFIKLDATSNGTFEIAQPSESRLWGKSGPTPDQSKRIKDAIYGTGNLAINQPTRTGNTTSPNTTTNIPKGRVVVQDSKGKKFHLPIEQLQSAITQGYTEVK